MTNGAVNHRVTSQASVGSIHQHCCTVGNNEQRTIEADIWLFFMFSVLETTWSQTCLHHQTWKLSQNIYIGASQLKLVSVPSASTATADTQMIQVNVKATYDTLFPSGHALCQYSCSVYYHLMGTFHYRSNWITLGSKYTEHIHAFHILFLFYL